MSLTHRHAPPPLARTPEVVTPGAITREAAPDHDALVPGPARRQATARVRARKTLFRADPPM